MSKRDFKVVAIDGKVYAVAEKLIKVTRADIEDGTPNDPDSCAIALAVRRATGCDASVGGPSITVGSYQRPVGVEKALDRRLAKFVIGYDGGGGENKRQVRPFSFVLRLRREIAEVPAALC